MSKTNETLSLQLDALLPQTQCGQCGFKGCLPYAEAIVSGTADINQCPPGGDAGIVDIARLLAASAKPLDTRFGGHKPKSVAFIIEPDCIGCTKCIAVCPVDAILGANKLMHTVIAAECTGCELCVAPCPVDCIVMKPVNGGEPDRAQFLQSAQRAKHRYQARNQRKAQEEAEKAERLRKQKQALLKAKQPA